MTSTPDSGSESVQEAADEVVPADEAVAPDEVDPGATADVEGDGVATVAPPADAELVAGHDLARAALHEITPANTVGEPAGYSVEADGVVSLRFENRLPGYPGWYWTVSLARVPDAAPTVLEVELLPGDAALLAPEWTPWDVRLADYQAAQVALAEAAGEDAVDGFDDDTDDDHADDLDAEDGDDDADAADFDDDVTPVLHAGDVDGVDIDELDVTADSRDDDDLDEDDEDEDGDRG